MEGGFVWVGIHEVVFCHRENNEEYLPQIAQKGTEKTMKNICHRLHKKAQKKQ